MMMLVIGIFLFILYLNNKREKNIRRMLQDQIVQLEKSVEFMNENRCIARCIKHDLRALKEAEAKLLNKEEEELKDE